MQSLGVIFDMDGVLVDSYGAHWTSWRETAEAFGLAMSEEDFARTFGRTAWEMIQQLWPGRLGKEQAGELYRKKEAAYRDILKRRFPAMVGASELIGRLHEAGFKLAIGSSGSVENVEVVRQSLPNGQFISAVVHGGEVKRGKPEPEVFLTAAGKLGMEPRRCAVIEDALVGLEAARQAGMAAIALVGTASREMLAKRAHRVVESLGELSAESVAEVIRAAAGNA